MKDHALFIFLSIVGLFLPSLFVIYSPFEVTSVISELTLTTLIQAEATIIGLFGIVFIYALTSYDNRRDRIEATDVDFSVLLIELKSNGKITDTKANAMSKMLDTSSTFIENLAAHKKNLINYSLISGFCLVLSLLFAILALSISNNHWLLILSTFSVTFLFVGIFQIFWTMYDLGQDPCRQAELPPVTPQN